MHRLQQQRKNILCFLSSNLLLAMLLVLSVMQVSVILQQSIKLSIANLHNRYYRLICAFVGVQNP